MNDPGFDTDMLCVLGCALGAAFVLGGAIVSMVAGKVANMTKGIYLEPTGTQEDNPFDAPDGIYLKPTGTHECDPFIEQFFSTSTDEQVPELTYEKFKEVLNNLPKQPTVVGEKPGSIYKMNYRTLHKLGWSLYHEQNENKPMFAGLKIEINPRIPNDIIVIEEPTKYPFEIPKMHVVMIEDEP